MVSVRTAAGYRSVARYSSLSSFISLKYVYSWLIARYYPCSNSGRAQHRAIVLSLPSSSPVKGSRLLKIFFFSCAAFTWKSPTSNLLGGHSIRSKKKNLIWVEPLLIQCIKTYHIHNRLGAKMVRKFPNCTDTVSGKLI